MDTSALVLSVLAVLISAVSLGWADPAVAMGATTPGHGKGSFTPRRYSARRSPRRGTGPYPELEPQMIHSETFDIPEWIDEAPKAAWGSVHRLGEAQDRRDIPIAAAPCAVTDQAPPTLRRADIARLLNVSNERARQITNGADFPAPIVTSPRRAWSREEVEWWTTSGGGSGTRVGSRRSPKP